MKRKTLKTFALSKSYSIIPFNGPHLTVSLESLRRKIVLKKYFIRRFIYAKIVRVVSPSSIVKQDLYSIIKSFNYAARDTVNYYSFVSGWSKLRKIVDGFCKSCAVTIAHKLNLKTADQVFKNNLGTGVIRLDA